MTAITGKLEAFGTDFRRMPSTLFMVVGIYFAFSLLYCSLRQIGFTALNKDNKLVEAAAKAPTDEAVAKKAVEKVGFKLPDKVILFSFLMMTVMFTIIIYLLPSGSR